MKVLQIVESAYRATLEEQDDTVLWLTQALKGAGASVDVLLRGNAVNYAIAGQNAEALAIGDWQQTQPPRIDHALATLIAKGVQVYALAEDLVERGLLGEPLLAGVESLPASALPRLVQSYRSVWHW